MDVVIKKIPGPWLALGVAAHFVARRDTFARFPAGDLVRTLSSQIQRGHYHFALDTSASPAKVVGYFGWALFDEAVGERFLATGTPPPDTAMNAGNVLWILTAAAENRRAFFALVKATRALYPDHRVMAVRHKPGGKRVKLDQSRARVSQRKSTTIAS